MKTRHFVTVWNPSVARGAMESHLQLLLEWARKDKARIEGSKENDDVYVWWGKVRSPSRQQPMDHLPQILETVTRDDPADEQHLYLTDYRSLYVALVDDIVVEDQSTDDPRHVPEYYRDQGLRCDCWFLLRDMRRLVVDDTVAVIEELKALRNTRYNDRPVSLYGGMVDLPLIVTRETERCYFAPEVRDVVTGGALWVEFDAERTGTGAMERELRENLFGETMWRRLHPSVRTFIATAENVFRQNRDDPAFDFSAVLVDFAKAVEVQAHETLRKLLHAAPPARRRVNVDGRTRDLLHDNLTLGQLGHALDDAELFRLLSAKGGIGGWMVKVFPAIAADLSESRNPAAHSSRTGLQRALSVRNRVLGIGCDSILAQVVNASNDISLTL